MGPARDWTDARAKVEAEGMCRVCGHWPAEAAHTVGRVYDQPKAGQKTRWVNPDAVVPLCRAHHTAYDLHSLDLLSYTTQDEQAYAVKVCGLENARIRLLPSEYRRVA